MSFLIANTSELQTALKIVSAVIPSNPVRPCLSHILMEGEGGKATLTAGDGTIFMRVNMHTLNCEDFRTVIPGKQITALAAKLTGQQTEIDITDKNATIRCHRSKTVMPVLDANDYPAMQDALDGFSICIASKVLRDLISTVLYCVGTDETRAILKGVLMEITADGIKTCALDGYRMSTMENRGSIVMPDGETRLRYVIPSDVCRLLMRCASDPDGDCQLTMSKTRIMAKFDGVTVSASLLAGEYPESAKFIPQDFERTVEVNRGQLMECLGRAELSAGDDDRKKAKLIRLNIDGDAMTISANSVTGTSTEEVDLIYNSMPTEPYSIAFNARFIVDAIHAVPDQNISMRFNKPVQPMIIMDEHEIGLQMVLPTRVIS